MTFKSFADDSMSVDIDGLTVENGTDSVAIHGETDITRDKPGLQKALKLKEIIDSAVAAMQADANLPDKIAPIVAPTTVANPFAKR